MDQDELGGQAQLAEGFLTGLLERLGVEASVSSQVQEDGFIEVNLTGEGLGILIGPRGTTLLALQELTRTVVQRQGHTGEARMVVDVNGYRKRRHEALARFTRQVAAEVARTGIKRALEPMPPADRKVVHDSVHGVPGVTSVSEGEEPNRRVVLVPLLEGPEAEQGPDASKAKDAGGEVAGSPGDLGTEKAAVPHPEHPGQPVPS